MAMTQDHRFRPLTGEALDNHLRTMHGWDARMIHNRGAEANASDDLMRDYAATQHEADHRTFEREQAAQRQEGQA